MIKTQILRYINHINDIDYLATIVNLTSAEALWEIIAQLLRSEDYETFDLTCLFIRDLVLFSSRDPDCEEFVKDYPQSCVVKTLEQLLFCANHFTRHQLIYTLGKTCSYDSLDVLNQAFIELRDTDPLLLPRLIGEMGWLGAENFWELIESMMMSQVYVTRWAVVDILDEVSGEAPREQNELF